MKMYGPFTLELKAYVVVDEGTTGTVTYNLGKPGQYVTEDDIDKAVAECERQIKEVDGDARLMTKPEFFNELVAERTGSGGQWATPGGSDWEVREAPSHD